MARNNILGLLSVLNRRPSRVLFVSTYFFYFLVVFMTMDLLEITDAKGKMHKHFLDDGSGEACIIVM
jgi:hypothetical protein